MKSEERASVRRKPAKELKERRRHLILKKGIKEVEWKCKELKEAMNGLQSSSQVQENSFWTAIMLQAFLLSLCIQKLNLNVSSYVI